MMGDIRKRSENGAGSVNPTRGPVPTRLLTAVQAGEMLGVCADTVRNFWDEGQLRFVRIGRGRKVSDAEVSRYIADHEKFEGDQ